MLLHSRLKCQPVATISQRRSSITSLLKARIVWRPLVSDKVDENGEEKSKRRTLKPLVKAALIMATAVDIVAEDADVVVSEVAEAIAEMANQVVDVEDTAAVEMHRQLSRSIKTMTPDPRTDTNSAWGVLKFHSTTLLFQSCGPKQHPIFSHSGVPLPHL